MPERAYLECLAWIAENIISVGAEGSLARLDWGYDFRFLECRWTLVVDSAAERMHWRSMARFIISELLHMRRKEAQ